MSSIFFHGCGLQLSLLGQRSRGGTVRVALKVLESLEVMEANVSENALSEVCSIWVYLRRLYIKFISTLLALPGTLYHWDSLEALSSACSPSLPSTVTSLDRWGSYCLI